MITMIAANLEDVIRLGELEIDGYFEGGFSKLAIHQVNAYLWRIWWLRTIRLLPGSRPYPGPVEG